MHVARVCPTHQHSGSKVKLVEELSDKDVCLDQVVLVSILDIPDDLREPLPLLLCTRHPDEEHLDKTPRKRRRMSNESC